MKIRQNGSTALGVMGGDSCSKGRGFESQNGLFSHLFVAKSYCVLENKTNEKEARDGPNKIKLSKIKQNHY